MHSYMPPFHTWLVKRPLGVSRGIHSKGSCIISIFHVWSHWTIVSLLYAREWYDWNKRCTLSVIGTSGAHCQMANGIIINLVTVSILMWVSNGQNITGQGGTRCLRTYYSKNIKDRVGVSATAARVWRLALGSRRLACPQSRRRGPFCRGRRSLGCPHRLLPVSYTHLTLPTKA